MKSEMSSVLQENIKSRNSIFVLENTINQLQKSAAKQQEIIFEKESRISKLSSVVKDQVDSDDESYLQ